MIVTGCATVAMRSGGQITQLRTLVLCHPYRGRTLNGRNASNALRTRITLLRSTCVIFIEEIIVITYCFTIKFAISPLPGRPATEAPSPGEIPYVAQHSSKTRDLADGDIFGDGEDYVFFFLNSEQFCELK